MHACAAQHFQQLPSYISMLWNPRVKFGALLMGRRVIREFRGKKVCIFPYSSCRLQRGFDGLQSGQQRTSHSPINILQVPRISSISPAIVSPFLFLFLFLSDHLVQRPWSKFLCWIVGAAIFTITKRSWATVNNGEKTANRF
ncbi:hypothetical protein QR685DRAFT_575293 [Neurospora intermedia]|uniref:Uncharacterized protein n=1 Tax=Neurospora intermedia TaxID=5142 RepID=A0ABR3D1W9_NEUIN